MATLTGQTLGKYQITERLGRGGMAEVYKAYHPQLERYAAIKILHHFLAEGQDFLARFQREAKSVAALHHPNIVQVYDFDVQGELYYMVMEYIDGGTLKDHIIQSDRSLPLDEAVRIIHEMASALDYAHQQGVLHRDVKPANVLLSQDGHAVLTDFGIAHIVSETHFTATGTLVGTPAYMSPEQGMGMPVSAASDIYSLGIILYEIIVGSVPFDSDTPLAVIHKHIHDPLPRPRELNPSISPALEKVIQKALEKEPADRYQSAGEFKNALDEALRESSAPTREVQRAPKGAEALSSASSPEVYDKSTVAMTPEEKPATQESLISRPTVAMEPEETPPKPPPVKREAEPAPAKKPPPKPAASKVQIKPLPIILGIAALALITFLLIWGIPKLTGGGADCDSPESCRALAEELVGSGDVEGAINAIEAAFNYIPENEHPSYAQYWCLKGEAHLAIEQFDDAISSFEECQAWTEGDPALEELRIFSQEKIDMINQR